MKYIITALAIALTIPVFAQQYKTAIEVPDLTKKGYKGKVKKIKIEAYTTKTVQGKLVPDKLSDVITDSFNREDFLVRRSWPIQKKYTSYNLGNSGYVNGSTYFVNGKPYSKDSIINIDKYSYIINTYKYNTIQKGFSTSANSTDTFLLNTNLLLKKDNDAFYEYSGGNDTIINTMTSPPLTGLVITNASLEKDEHGNITRSLVESEISGAMISIYKYEYYK